MEGSNQELPANSDLGGVLKRQVLLAIALCLGALGCQPVFAQFPLGLNWQIPQPPDPNQSTSVAAQTQDPTPAKPDSADKPAVDNKSSAIDSPQPKVQPDDSQVGQQTKRILWILPNYRSVSANTYLPPQSFKEKVWLATQDSFDYSGFIWVGMVAGISMAGKSEPSFGQGASGYGIYYAHALADNTIENYLVEAFVPAVTKEDPRYYTLGHGGFFKRTGYSISRLFITRTDSESERFNISEVVGAGAAAGISNAYYPQPSNMWVKTYQRWASQIIQDGISNIAKEFWPDVNHALFHNKY